MQRHEQDTRALLAICCLAALVAGCGNGSQAPTPRPPTSAGDGSPESADRLEPRVGEAVSVTRKRTAPEPVADAGTTPVPLFDFAANLERAHIRSHGLLVDFGTPSRHKHTLGDWKTGWRGDYRDGETTFSYVEGAAARIYFDTLQGEEGGGRIELRARAVGSGRGRVYLNGVHLGNVDLRQGGFQHAAVSFEKGIVAGQNEILLRFDAKKPGHDGRGAAVAVDYVRVVAGTETEGP
ncbi:MAG TPA: hypothetical protein VM285_06810, partial [Polyangia bacterium]|nr:hypothetical protein [Polyangia bacterium]